MIRSTPTSATRAAQKLIGAEACSCDQTKILTARLAKLHELADRLERENAALRAELEKR